MRRFSGLFLLAVAGCTAASPRPAAPPTPGSGPSSVAGDSNPYQLMNDLDAQRIADRIGSRKNEPAAQVFENIKIEWLKDIPAERLLLIMNLGYSRALGVSCTHCHVEQDFASDEKRPKRAAREMAIMHRGVNDQLRQMQSLESPAADRNITCFTCHRGTINPNKAEP